MADFLSSLKQGMDAAARSNREKLEIRAVLEELNRQLHQGTNGILEITLHKFSGKGNTENVPSILRLISFESHTGLGLVHKKYKNELPIAELAVWKQEGGSGYPCEIIFGSTRMSAADRASLEKTLKLLLSDPSVGGKITEYLHFSPKLPMQVSGDGKAVIAKAGIVKKGATAHTTAKKVVATSLVKKAATAATVAKSRTSVMKKDATTRTTAKKVVATPLTKKAVQVSAAAKYSASVVKKGATTRATVKKVIATPLGIKAGVATTTAKPSTNGGRRTAAEQSKPAIKHR